MSDFSVLIPDRAGSGSDIEAEELDGFGEVISFGAKHSDEIPDDVWRSADLILAWHDLSYDAGLIEKLDKCRGIVRIGVGFDNVDLEAAGRRGIVVCNVPDYGTEDVADHALGMAVGLARGLPRFDASFRHDEGAWDWSVAGNLRRLRGSVFGVVGFGRIGIAAARRAAAFGMDVVFYDPYVRDGLDKATGTERVDTLEALARRADVVSLHTPLTAETTGLIDDAFFSMLKPGAVLVNTARGGVVSLDALHRALESGVLAAAGLDVLDEEPPSPDHPLISAWRREDPWIRGRLLLSPHSAFFCEEAYIEMRRKAAREGLRILRGDPPRNCVNRTFLVGES